MKLIESLISHKLYISVITLGTWAYVYKHSIPLSKPEQLINTFNFVDATSDIAKKSLFGPTNDFEDNVQLHSASDSNCNTFVTKDAKLLKLGYFGKVRICDSL